MVQGSTATLDARVMRHGAQSKGVRASDCELDVAWISKESTERWDVYLSLLGFEVAANPPVTYAEPADDMGSLDDLPPGIDLNSLVGREFSIGAVRIRAIRLCEPCNYLAKQTSPQILHGLVHKGGIRAQILSAGEIRVGDEIIVH